MKEKIMQILANNQWAFEEPHPSVHFPRIADDIIDDIIEAIKQEQNDQYKNIKTTALVSLDELHALYTSLLNFKSYKTVVLDMNDDDKEKTIIFIKSLYSAEVKPINKIEKFIYGGVEFVFKK